MTVRLLKKNCVELLIDTTQQNKIVLRLLQGRRIVGKFSKADVKISENLLPAIAKLLKKARVKLSDIKKVSVNPGPGGFSSTRTGVATANALNFALGLDKFVMPKYDKMPNITKSRK